MESKIKKIIANQLCSKIAGVVNEARLIEELGADELDRIELTMALEEEFGICISDDDADKWVTVGDVVSYIENNKKG